MSTETNDQPEAEAEAEGTVPLVADFSAALQWAIDSRRGCLLKAAPLPDRRKLTNKDLENLRDLLAGLIDALSDRERRLTACAEDLSPAQDLLEDIADAPFREVITRCKEACSIVSKTAAALTAVTLRRSDFDDGDD